MHRNQQHVRQRKLFIFKPVASAANTKGVFREPGETATSVTPNALISLKNPMAKEYADDCELLVVDVLSTVKV